MLLEAFVWPVSAVMKLWHWLLAQVFAVAPDTAWVLSIILLVVTVRGFLVPFNWSMFKSSRIMLMMRPEQEELEERYGKSTDPQDVAAHDAALKKLNKDYGYNAMTGCIPPLVQLPFILGLYRLLMWMSVPENGRTDTNIGLLTPEDIASFLDASFMGVPLPAYVSMTSEQFAALGTTGDQVRAVGIPLLIFALIFTTINTAVSQFRSRIHLDWNQSTSRKMYKTMWAHAGHYSHLARLRGHDRSDPGGSVDVLVPQQPVDPDPIRNHVVLPGKAVPAGGCPPEPDHLFAH